MIIDKFLTSLPNDLSYSFRIRKNIKVKIMFKNKNNLKKSNRINKKKMSKLIFNIIEYQIIENNVNFK